MDSFGKKLREKKRREKREQKQAQKEARRRAAKTTGAIHARIILLIVGGMLFAASRAHARDLCQSPASTSVAISGAATTKLIAGVAGQQTRICGFLLSFTGTTFQLIQGTTVSTPCDTGAANLTGAFAPPTGAPISYGGAGTSIMTAKAAQDVCVVTTGSTPSLQGVLSSVQE